MHVERDHNKEIDDLYLKVHELSRLLFRLTILVTLMLGVQLWLLAELLKK